MTGNNHDIQRDDRRCRHCERQSGECAVRCHDCDGWLCGDCAGTETVECGCGNTVCDDCARTCNECGSRMCGDCAYCCEHCEHSLCEDCGYRCRMCDERYCPYCYERHACANTQDPCYRDPYEGRHRRQPRTFASGPADAASVGFAADGDEGLAFAVFATVGTQLVEPVSPSITKPFHCLTAGIRVKLFGTWVMLVGITDERFGTVQRHTFQHDFLAHISNNTTLRVIWKKESCDSSPRLKAGAPSQQDGGQ